MFHRAMLHRAKFQRASFHRLLTAACTLAFAAAAAAGLPAADPVKANLEPKLEPGEQHRYTLDIESLMRISSTSVPDQVRTQGVTQTIDFVMTVKDVNPATGCTLEVRYDSLKFEFDSPEGKRSFNSADPAAPPAPPEGAAENEAAPALRPVVGTVLTVSVDSKGNVSEVTGGESLAGIDFWGQVAGQFGQREVVAAFIEPVINTRHGAGEAAVGDTWTHANTLDESAVGTFRITTNHTLESISGAEATVRLSGAIESVPPKAEEGMPAVEGTEPPLKVTESTNSGSYVWDTAAGVLSRLEQQQSVSMSTTMQGMAMDVENKTTLKLARKQPAPELKPAPAPTPEPSKPAP